MNPTPVTKVLQSIQDIFVVPIFLIVFFFKLVDSKDSISSGTWLHILDPRQNRISFPLNIILNYRILKVKLFLRLWRF